MNYNPNNLNNINMEQHDIGNTKPMVIENMNKPFNENQLTKYPNQPIIPQNVTNPKFINNYGTIVGQLKGNGVPQYPIQGMNQMNYQVPSQNVYMAQNHMQIPNPNVQLPPMNINHQMPSNVNVNQNVRFMQPNMHVQNNRTLPVVANKSYSMPARDKTLKERPNQNGTFTPETKKRIDRNIDAKKRKVIDKTIPKMIKILVPEVNAFETLLEYEKKLDLTMNLKKLDLQEALKRPETTREKKTLRLYISTTYYPPGKSDSEIANIGSWDLKIEGRLLNEDKKNHKKFSNYFKSLVIELDRNQYGPDNHLVEWHKSVNSGETDGFQVKRMGDQDVKVTILLMLDYRPLRFKLDVILSKLLGIHTDTMANIINALWIYIKNHKLQDPVDRWYINLDCYLQRIFEVPRIQFSDIPQLLKIHCHPPEPIVVNYVIQPDAQNSQKCVSYDVQVETNSDLKDLINKFLASFEKNDQLSNMNVKIYDIIENLNKLSVSREFYVQFANDPQLFIYNWIQSQAKDYKIMTENLTNPEEQRYSKFYNKPWINEAVSRYIYSQLQYKRMEVENILSNRKTNN
ncbi:SWI/SNF complex component SNF12 [Intoshia linei]|uniref:SWI/SNF complex component SNF12 n=1 Tax=Intoshia linei TaxID=1819745 RepID=A0A177BDU2_9BILA|nr:SWI/SNF complex component SNF12 [Intoshia linei]